MMEDPFMRKVRNLLFGKKRTNHRLYRNEPIEVWESRQLWKRKRVINYGRYREHYCEIYENETTMKDIEWKQLQQKCN